MRRRGLSWYSFLMFIPILFVNGAIADLKTDLDALTGGIHTRLVWTHGAPQNDQYGGIDRFYGKDIMAFDSKTNALKKIAGPYAKLWGPMLHNGGNSVIYSTENGIYTIDFAGLSAPRFLVAGKRCTDVWIDGDKKEWAIVERNSDITRFLISDPTKSVTMYPHGNVGGNHDFTCWAVTGDGAFSIAQLPWSNFYYIPFNSTTASMAGYYGCMSTVTSDNSHIWGFADGGKYQAHEYVSIVKDKAKMGGDVHLSNQNPAGTSNDRYHWRFASNAAGAHYFLYSGGYPQGFTGGECADVFIGRFNDNYSAFVGCVRITNHPCQWGNQYRDNANFWPDAWVGVEQSGPSELTTLIPSATITTVAAKGQLPLKLVHADQSGSPFPVSGVVWTLSGGGSLTNKSDSSATFVSDGTLGDFTVTAAAGGKQGQLKITVIDMNKQAWRYNCGGPDVTVNGVVWKSAKPFASNGTDSVLKFSAPLDTSAPNSAPSVIYKTALCGAHSLNLTDIPDGNYLVRLHFADWANVTRSMNFTIEDTMLIKAFNTVTAAGGVNKTYVKDLIVAVKGGNGLQIKATANGTSMVFENGIEILPSSSAVAFIKVLTPTANATFFAGDTVHLTWENASNVYGVTVSLSLDGGRTYEYISPKAIENDGSNRGKMDWRVPDTLFRTVASYANVCFKVADYSLGSIAGEVTKLTFAKDKSGVRQLTAISSGEHRRLIVSSPVGGRLSLTNLSGTPVAVRMYDLKGSIVFSAAVAPFTTAGAVRVSKGTYCLEVVGEGRRLLPIQ